MTLVSLAMLGWLAGTTILTWLTPRRFQPYTVALGGALFLLYYSPVSLAILSLTSLFCLAQPAGRFSVRDIMIVGIGGMAGLLVWFKGGRFIDPSYQGSTVIPLGMSYFILRQIHFLVDRWKGILPETSWGQTLCYFFFFPTLMAGPINRFQEFHRSLRRRRWDAKLFSHGCERILYGYAKIVILGNFLISSRLNYFIEDLESNHQRLAAYLDCARYGLNLYFQFSGYSDVAIGFAMVLGFSIEENFNYPFLCVNISDFWKRWHISLSSWCRDYIYMPVWSISRDAKIAVICSMLILGLWHEISARYLIWGLYHGAGIAVWQRFQGGEKKLLKPLSSWGKKLVTFISWFVTINFVLLGFAITKEADLWQAYEIFKIILGMGGK